MTVIDKQTWPRRAIYDFFAPMSDPFYTLTFPVDVTALRAWCRGKGLPFYPAMVFAVTRAMEAVEAFRYKDRDGVIVRHDTLVPSFTDLRPGSETFHIVTLETGEDPADFCRRAKEQSAAQTQFITAGPWDADQLVYFTCLPWFPVTALKKREGSEPLRLGAPGGLGPVGGEGGAHRAAAEPGAQPPPAGRGPRGAVLRGPQGVDETAMTADDFRARWAGHEPGPQDLTGEYAVLVPLVERPEGLCLLYEVRASSLDRQPGEVCFPGGEDGAGRGPGGLRPAGDLGGAGHSAGKGGGGGPAGLPHPPGGLRHVPRAGGGGPGRADGPRPRRGGGGLLRAGGLAEAEPPGGVRLRSGPPMWGRTSLTSALASPRATAGGAGRWRCRCTTGRATPSGASPAASPGT